MDTQAPLSPADELVAFVMNAVTVTDAQKDVWLEALIAGQMPPDLLAGLDALCDAEVAAAQAEEAVLAGALEAQRVLEAEEQGNLLPGVRAVLAEHEQALAGILGEHTQACLAIERGVDKGVEGAVAAQETTEADAIRAMLKQKPGDTAP